MSLFFKLEGEALELTSDIRSLGQQVNVWDIMSGVIQTLM